MDLDLFAYAKFVLALIFVLGLIGLLAAAARKWGLGLPAAQVRRGKDKRLSIVEVAGLDTKRRMVLLRRDDVEHLVILGPDGETVIERGIKVLPSESFSEIFDSTHEKDNQDTPLAKGRDEQAETAQ